MGGIRIPFYGIDRNIWIDAYLIANVEFKYNRVLMIKEHADSIEPQIKPLPFNEVLNLMREGYNDLLALINEVESRVETRRSIRILEVLALPIYNPSQYLARRENEAVILPLLNILRRFYEDLMPKISKAGDVKIGPWKYPLGITRYSLMISLIAFTRVFTRMIIHSGLN